MGGCRKEGSQPHRARRSIDLAFIPSTCAWWNSKQYLQYSLRFVIVVVVEGNIEVTIKIGSGLEAFKL